MAESEDTPTPDGASEKKRSARHIKAAAKILQKEARKILRKYGSRIAAEPAEAMRACVAAIDTHRDAGNVDGLEEEAEKLDELLHHHASFARKSALRETLENIAIAVFIALLLRSCFYEPFKIPSGSMMPTLRKGDHIFVNKFVYGVQIPFTNTVVGSSLGEIEHGDVVVFRYPIDESEDFIKRVVGLPGDEVKVTGRVVSVKHAGENEFQILERTLLEDKCYDEENERVVAGCHLFEETHGENTYVVRYMTTLEERQDFIPKSRIWKVPEGHLLVMGDNRNQSHDSLQWTVRVEAVDADKILGDKDLRDLTEEKLFTQTREGGLAEQADASHDAVTWMSTHRSKAHDVSLSIWRSPPLGSVPMFDALAHRMPGGEELTVAQLVAEQDVPKGAALDRTLEVGARIDRLVVERRDDGFAAVAYLEPADALVMLDCGKKACKNQGRLAARLTEAVGRFEEDHDQATREILAHPKGVEYGTRWSGRSDVRDRYYQRLFAKRATASAEAPPPEQSVRLRVFRKPKQDADVLQDAALRAVGSSAADADTVPDVAERAWLVERGGVFTFVGTDDVRNMVVVLDCAKVHCKDRAGAIALAKTIWERLPKAASDRRKLKRLLSERDLGEGWTEASVVQPERNPFDRTRLEATIQGKDHSLEVEAWYKPAAGLAAQVAAVQAEYDLAPSDAIRPGGASAEGDKGYSHVFAVEESQTVIRIRCRPGLCADSSVAVGLARRAASKATDPSTFIDPDAERPKPFVPRGNVKGRAERIWLPFDRFWLEIR